MSTTFDFIVVGAGPSGCALASRLSRSRRSPSVLLVEAGEANDNRDLRVEGEKWLTRMNKHMNYSYKSVPQKSLNNRVIDYDRGKGLGGSSAINFCVFNVGAKDDFDDIARATDDQDWSWSTIQQRFCDLESFHGEEVDPILKPYLSPKASDHGTSGRLNIGFQLKAERTLPGILDICEEAGHPLNPDLNSGNPIGFGISPSSAYRGLRRTAADLLKGPPANLTIVRDTTVYRILFEEDSAVGIETGSWDRYLAAREVLLCAGSIDSPKLLLLSGIGPADQLSKFGIPVVKDLPMVGKGLRDHFHLPLLWKRVPETSSRPAYYRDPDAVLKAKEQWNIDGSGPLAEIGVGLGIGYLKSERVYDSLEFAALPTDVKRYLASPTVPLFEVITNSPDPRDFLNPTGSEASSAFYIMMMNPQSTGSVELKSKDPVDPPLIDPNASSHPYDDRVVIEGVRTVLDLVNHPSFAKDTLGPVDAPKSSSDEDILAFWRQNAASTWHPTSTIQIDNTYQGHACLDTSLRVHGVSGLRVGDVSVLPLLPNCHTQSTAYVVGATLGDKLAREYGLDSP